MGFWKNMQPMQLRKDELFKPPELKPTESVMAKNSGEMEMEGFDAAIDARATQFCRLIMGMDSRHAVISSMSILPR